MRNVLIVLGSLAVSLLGTAFYFGFLGFIFMIGWNYVIPEAFHGPTLTLVQSAVILFLASLLYGAMGPKKEPTAYVIKGKDSK